MLLLGCAATWQATELAHSAMSGWSTAQTLVVQDSAAFVRAWEQLYPIASFRPTLPPMDFAKNRVFIVAAGTKPTGGHRLALSGAEVVGDSALISVTLFTPPPGCSVSEALTTPALAIAVPVTPIPFRIIFHERADTVRCN